jgi:hypothetical protein
MSAAGSVIAPYPRDQETDVVLRDGSTVHVRPVRAADKPALRAFLEALSPVMARPDGVLIAHARVRVEAGPPRPPMPSMSA